MGAPVRVERIEVGANGAAEEHGVLRSAVTCVAAHIWGMGAPEEHGVLGSRGLHGGVAGGLARGMDRRT